MISAHTDNNSSEGKPSSGSSSNEQPSVRQLRRMASFRKKQLSLTNIVEEDDDDQGDDDDDVKEDHHVAASSVIVGASYDTYEEQDHVASELPIDYDTLLMALDECELELGDCKSSLNKVKRKNKELVEDFAEQRAILSELEDRYAMVKLELAQVKTDDDNLLVATQKALGDRDVIILDLTTERDQLSSELKRVSKERHELDSKTRVLEECLAAKDLRLLSVVAENDSLKEELKRARRELEAERCGAEVIDLHHQKATTVPHSTLPSLSSPKVTVVTNRWTRGFRNPLKRRTSVTPKPAMDELSIAKTEDSSRSFTQNENDYIQ